MIDPCHLGSQAFRADYNLKYACFAGAMYKGVASKELVVRMGKAEMMGFFGSGGLNLDAIEHAILYIKSHLHGQYSYGMNLLSDIEDPESEIQTVLLYQKHTIKNIEAAAFMQITPALVLHRLHKLSRYPDGKIKIHGRIIAKLSRPEIAELFMKPPPENIVRYLLNRNLITPEEADLSKYIPMSHDICAEADSAGHTDRASAFTLIPSMLSLRARIMSEKNYSEPIRIGAAGGIGTPQTVAAAFLLGADFVVTGSINQCTPEAGTSDEVKTLLQTANVQDTTYAPAGDLFEMGAQVQVFRKGILFSARANKLYELYKRYDSIEDIPLTIQQQIQEKFFRKEFSDVWREVEEHYHDRPKVINDASINKKLKMALIFKWYFAQSTRYALSGSQNKVDYQIHCGPALGAFNQYVLNTKLEDWRNRHVDIIAELLMKDAAQLIHEKYLSWTKLI